MALDSFRVSFISAFVPTGIRPGLYFVVPPYPLSLKPRDMTAEKDRHQPTTTRHDMNSYQIVILAILACVTSFLTGRISMRLDLNQENDAAGVQPDDIESSK